MNRYLRWDQAIEECQRNNESWVMATVLSTQGSTPRNVGSKMVITASTIYDTIGGGQLEYKVTGFARELIEKGESCQTIEHFPLSAKANQCCGGTMSILLECFSKPCRDIHVFGAGHVAQALVPILAQLDTRIHWIDSRENIFPEPSNTNIKLHFYDDVVQHVESMKPHSFAIVLTHQHSLDYTIIEALLDRKDCAYIGLIGSKTKSLRFKRRLQQASFSEQEINSVICPVGLLDIPGKQPIEVAVSIAAQVIQQLHLYDNDTHSHRTNSPKNTTQALMHPLLPYKN